MKVIYATVPDALSNYITKN